MRFRRRILVNLLKAFTARLNRVSAFFTLCAILSLSRCAFAQGETALKAPFGVGVGIKVSLLGAGLEAAVPIARKLNVRAGFNAFSYNRTFDKDGVSYAGQLRFRSSEAHLDWFPFGGSFHVSPGLLVYNGNQVTASADVPGGNTFTLNDTDYTSDPANPITGSGKIDYRKTAPMISVGWGNLVPRSGRHFSAPFEIGMIFSGAPQAAINLAGGACDSNGVNCQSVNTDPTFQSNLQSEQDKINHDMAPFKYYPIISLGFGFRF
jgi:hypothetical protein